MGKNIYVGNLPYDTTGDDLVQLFQTYGTVTSGQVIIDKFSGRSRGFGFVEMANDDEAQAAIEALNGTSYGNRPLTVNEARPREERGGSRGWLRRRWRWRRRLRRAAAVVAEAVMLGVEGMARWRAIETPRPDLRNSFGIVGSQFSRLGQNAASVYNS